AWPGQALAYKTGELKIQELRKRAEQKLGDKFDIRQFHAEVRKDGSVPLEVLEQKVDAWIADAGKQTAQRKPQQEWPTRLLLCRSDTGRPWAEARVRGPNAPRSATGWRHNRHRAPVRAT